MRGKIAAVGALTGVLAIGLLIATLLPASSATTLKFYVRNNQGFSRNINVDGKRSAVGDYAIAVHALYRVGTHNKVGRDIEQAFFIQPLAHHDARFRVAATFRTPRGKLEIAGASKVSTLLNGTAKFSITGGTGAYNGAGGTLVAHQKRYRTIFTLHVVP